MEGVGARKHLNKHKTNFSPNLLLFNFFSQFDQYLELRMFQKKSLTQNLPYTSFYSKICKDFAWLFITRKLT